MNPSEDRIALNVIAPLANAINTRTFRAEGVADDQHRLAGGLWPIDSADTWANS